MSSGKFNVGKQKQSTATFLYVYLVDETDGYTPETGIISPTITVSKNGGAFAAPSDGTWSELASGWYKAALDATDTNTLGALAVNVAKTGCRNFMNTVEVVSGTVDDLITLVTRALGLVQENYYLDNTTYDSGRLSTARVRIYDSAVNVGTDIGVVATYNITATYAGSGLATYKVVKS